MGQLIFLANSGGAASADHLLLLNPAGVAGGITYTTFETVVAAANAITGPVRVYVSPGVTIVPTGAGPYDMTDIYWESDQDNPAIIEFGAVANSLSGSALHLKDIIFRLDGVNLNIAWTLANDVVVEVEGVAQLRGGRHIFFDANGNDMQVYGRDNSVVTFVNLVTSGVAGSNVTLVFSGSSVPSGSGNWGANVASTIVYMGYAPDNTLGELDAFTVKPVIRREVPFVLTPPQITGDVANYNPDFFAAADVLLLDLDAPHNISGFANNGGVVDSSFVTVKKVVNTSANAATIVDGAGTVPTQTGTGANLVLAQYEVAIIIYDPAGPTWIANKI